MFKQSMITMNNLLLDLFIVNKRPKMMQHMLYRLYSNHRDHANDFLIDDIHPFDGKPQLYFGWILKQENIAAVTK